MPLSSISQFFLQLISSFCEARATDMFSAMTPATELYNFDQPLWKVELVQQADAGNPNWFYWDIDTWAGSAGTLADVQRQMLEYHLRRRASHCGGLLASAGLHPEATDPSKTSSRIKMLRAPTPDELLAAGVTPPDKYGSELYFLLNDILRAKKYVGKPRAHC